MKKGFSLLEFVIVVAILTIIMVTGSISMRKFRQNSEKNRVKRILLAEISFMPLDSFNLGEEHKTIIDLTERKITASKSVKSFSESLDLKFFSLEKSDDEVINSTEITANSIIIKTNSEGNFIYNAGDDDIELDYDSPILSIVGYTLKKGSFRLDLNNNAMGGRVRIYNSDTNSIGTSEMIDDSIWTKQQ